MVRYITRMFIPPLLFMISVMLGGCDGYGFDSSSGHGCPETISLDRSQLTIAEGRIGNIKVRGGKSTCWVDWTNSDWTIVTLNNSNVGAGLKGRQPGTATITAYRGWDRSVRDSAMCKVTVLPVSAREIHLSPDTVEVVAESYRHGTLQWTVTDSVGVAIERILTWTSSDTSIARAWGPTDFSWIGNPGKVHGYKPGEITVTASYGDISASAHVRVVAADWNGVWGSASDDVFAVGELGRILHYDGNAWSRMPDVDEAELMAVWGSGPTDVYAVGHVTGTNWRSISYYDGNDWGFQPTGRPTGWFGTFRGVWGMSDGVIVAVGDGGLIIHHKDNAWSHTYTDNRRQLLAVWGSAAEDIYAVGARGELVHYDGQGWSSVESGVDAVLTGIWGTSGNDIYVVGHDYTHGIILHWDGHEWQSLNLTAPHPQYAVWGNGAGNVFAVGDNGMVLHSDGNNWTTLATPTTECLTSVWGSSGTDVFAVGTRGTILHFDGQSWTKEVH